MERLGGISEIKTPYIEKNFPVIGKSSEGEDYKDFE